MPKKLGAILAAAGVVLILSALLLQLYNRQEDAAAGQAAEQVLGQLQAQLQTQLPTRVPTAPPQTWMPDSTQPVQTLPPDPALKVVELDGYGYVGVLTIPALQLQLPVMAEWDYVRLKIAPCRQFGSSKSDDLVIAGHNYASFFRDLSKMQPGDWVSFTDMEGNVNGYRVVSQTLVDPKDVEAVQNSGFDLVLYTCTTDATARVTVFCTRQTMVSEE